MKSEFEQIRDEIENGPRQRNSWPLVLIAMAMIFFAIMGLDVFGIG